MRAPPFRPLFARLVTLKSMAVGAARLHGLHRFHAACVLGMVLSGYLAEVVSGFGGSSWVHPFSVHLLSALALLRLATARRCRDFFLVKVVAAVLMLDAAIRSTSLWYFFFLLCFLLLTAGAMVSGEIRRAAERSAAISRAGLAGLPSRLAALSVLACAGILLLAGAMFFLLPRTARVAARHLVSRNLIPPGFANEIILGRTGRLQPSDRTVMHVRFDGPPGPVPLKWRGGSLGEFDGKRWYNSPAPVQNIEPQGGVVWLMDNRRSWQGGRRLTYEVALHSPGTSELFFAGNPLLLRLADGQGVVRTTGDGFRTRLPGGNLRYAAVSAMESETESSAGVTELSRDERNYYLLLPPFDIRVITLARRLTEGHESVEAKVRAIEEHLRSQYAYTTELPSTTVRDPLAHFLFERKKGHCEYFAGAMAVMLRSVWIPSRIATGYLGGVYNPISGWYAVRARDAHSWVEAWIPGRGWMAFDPTPPAPAPTGESYAARLWLWADAAETFWLEWILNYDLDRQLTLVNRLERSGRGLRTWWPERWPSVPIWDLLLAAAAAAAAVALALLGTPRFLHWWRVRRRVQVLRSGQASTSDATLLYQRVLRRLARLGIEKPPFQTPLEFARSLRSPELAAQVEALTRAYNRLRFGREPEAAADLLAAIEAIEPRIAKGDGLS